MQTSTKLAATGGAAVAACAACCAVSLVPAAIAGTGLIAVGGAATLWGGIALLAVVPLAAFVWRARSRSRPHAVTFNAMIASSGMGCGCSASPSVPSVDDAVIACTLSGDDFKARAEAIRSLAKRSLRRATRTRLSLWLTYEPGAFEEVRGLVLKEQECCAFLDFNLRQDASGVYLIITAPQAAADAADLLFDHFAPNEATEQFLMESAR